MLIIKLIQQIYVLRQLIDLFFKNIVINCIFHINFIEFLDILVDFLKIDQNNQ